MLQNTLEIIPYRSHIFFQCTFNLVLISIKLWCAYFFTCHHDFKYNIINIMPKDKKILHLLLCYLQATTFLKKLEILRTIDIFQYLNKIMMMSGVYNSWLSTFKVRKKYVYYCTILNLKSKLNHCFLKKIPSKTRTIILVSTSSFWKNENLMITIHGIC